MDVLHTLALSDGWVIGIGTGQMLFNTAVGVFMFRLSEHVKRVRSLEDEVKRYAQEQVDAQIAATNNMLRAEMKLLSQRLATSAERLQRGDAEFDRISEITQAVQIGLATKIGELRTEIANTCVTKRDLQAMIDRLPCNQCKPGGPAERGRS